MSGRADRMLERLQFAGVNGVCLSEVDFADSYTARNGISTLRQRGYRIESMPCRLHGHHGRVLRFRLAEGGQSNRELTVGSPPTVSSPNPHPPTLAPSRPTGDTASGAGAAVGSPAVAPSPELFPAPYQRRGNSL